MQALQSFWLSIWSSAVHHWQNTPSSHEEQPVFPVMHYMTVYFAIGVAAVLVQFLSTIILIFSTLNASQVLLYIRVDA